MTAVAIFSQSSLHSIETACYKVGMNQTHVVIVGGGFGGINVAKKLIDKKNIQVTLVDRRNYHLFQPLLYQVATAGLSPADIATPIRTLFAKSKNVDVRLGNVQSVSPKENFILADNEKLHYDYLVLACGAKHSYFGHNEWEVDAPGLKTLEQATEIRRRILLAFELAEKENDPEKRKMHLTFVIVGGGPTGVELAGAIAEISHYTLAKDFKHIDPTHTRVVLIEANSRVLMSFSEKLSQKAAKDLENLGVQIWTNTRVTNIKGTEVHTTKTATSNETLKSSTVLWAAGVQPSSLGKTLGTELDPQGRVKVQKNLTIKNFPNIFVIGDQAAVNDEHLPGLAPVAMQQGRTAAENILLNIQQKPMKNFVYNDKGQMATIGRKKAVLQTQSGIQIGGLIAWLAWLFVHIYYLIGFKNRIFVFMQWAWSYLTFKRGARLIIDKEWRSIPPPPK